MRICRRGRFICITTYLLLISLPLIFMPESAWLLAQQRSGDELLEQGKQYYMEERFEEAVENLTLALKLLLHKDKLIDAYLYLALCHFALGESDKAEKHLAELLKINPAQRLNQLYSQDFINLCNKAKQGISARLKVDTEPAEAQVYLDGEMIGLTPLQLQTVEAGEHKLIIVKLGYKLQERSLIVKEGEEKTVSLKLEKQEKKPAVAVSPAEKKPEVKKGKDWLWILLGGAAAAAVAILATRGGKETAGPVPTTQAFGSIQVKSYPNGANIFLDGQDTGFKTNHTLTNIPTGSRTILLRKAGWKDWQEQVTVYANQTAVVKPCLLPPNGCFRDNFQDGDADGWEFPRFWKLSNEGGNYFLEGEVSQPGTGGAAEPDTENRKGFKLRFRLKLFYGDLTVHFRSVGSYRYQLEFNEFGIFLGKDQNGFHNVGRVYTRISSGVWHNIEAIAQGDNFQIFLDNRLMLNIHDHNAILMSGSFYFTIWGEGHAKVDDIVVISEECP